MNLSTVIAHGEIIISTAHRGWEGEGAHQVNLGYEPYKTEEVEVRVIDVLARCETLDELSTAFYDMSEIMNDYEEHERGQKLRDFLDKPVLAVPQ